MCKWDPPRRLRSLSRKCLLEKIPMLRELEQAIAAEEILLRCVDADEFDVASVAETIEQPRRKRRAARSLFGADALTQIEVILDLRPVIALLGLVIIVIADGGIDRNAVDDVAIRLEVG